MKNIILIAAFLALSSSCLADTAGHFTYRSGDKGEPKKWSEIDHEWRICGEGKSQSPIDLNPKIATIVHNKTELLQTFYKPLPAILKNRGHDIMVSWKGNPGKIVIDNTDYNLVQAHWHAPSEHFIQGKRYAIEVHLVHKSAAGGLAVIGLLYQKGPPKPFLTRITDKIKAIQDIQDGEIDIGVVDPRELGLDLRSFYKYHGSLTTPPCSEGVIWIILNKIATASLEQVDVLTSARRTGCEVNARPAQPLNGRVVYLNGPQSMTAANAAI